MKQKDCRSGLFHSTSPGDHGHVWWGYGSTCNLPPLRNIHLSLRSDQTSLVCHFLTTLWMNSFHKASIENPECTLVYWFQSSPNTFDKSGSIQCHLRWQKKHDIKHTLQFMWRLKKKKNFIDKNLTLWSLKDESYSWVKENVQKECLYLFGHSKYKIEGRDSLSLIIWNDIRYSKNIKWFPSAGYVARLEHDISGLWR